MNKEQKQVLLKNVFLTNGSKKNTSLILIWSLISNKKVGNVLETLPKNSWAILKVLSNIPWLLIPNKTKWNEERNPQTESSVLVSEDSAEPISKALFT